MIVQLLPGTSQAKARRIPGVYHVGTPSGSSGSVLTRKAGTLNAVKLVKNLQQRISAYSSDEPRDEAGRWTDGGEAHEAYKQTRDAYRGPAASELRIAEAGTPYEKMSDAQREKYFAAADRGRKLDNEWERSTREALSEGRVSLADAKARGFYAGGHDHDNEGRPIDAEGHKAGWQPLPPSLFHVTTAKDAVLAGGLKTRAQLHQSEGKGLGGGDDNTISFATDEKGAENIYHSMLEAHRVATGELSVADLLKAAQEGRSAKRPFLTDVMRTTGDSKWNPGDPTPSLVKDLLEGKETESTGLGKTADELPKGAEPSGYHWTGGDGKERYGAYRIPLDADQQQDRRFDFYKSFLWNRESAGGPENPLFFSTDVKGLAAIPKDQIAIVHATPVRGAQGYPLSALSEWRTHSGRAVKVVGMSQPTPEIRAALEDLAITLRQFGISVNAYSEDEARDEAGRWTGGGVVFVSPNVKENLSFEDAVKGLGSDRQRQIRQMADNLLHSSSVDYKISNVIGDWSDGAENSLFIRVDADPAKTAYLASKMGMASQQKAVIAFTSGTSGKDSVWTIKLKGTDLNRTRSVLDSVGVKYRSLETHQGNTLVHVFDEDTGLADAVKKAAYNLKGRVAVSRGSGEFIGGESRNEGLQRYRERISGYGKSGASISGGGSGRGYHGEVTERRRTVRDYSRTEETENPLIAALKRRIAAVGPPDEARDEKGEWTDGGGGEVEKDGFIYLNDELKIPRTEMPQITKENIPDYIRWLGSRGISSREETVPAATLKPIQERISKHVAENTSGHVNLPGRPMIISRDNFILDGHHRWYQARREKTDLNVLRVDSNMTDLLKETRDYPKVEYRSGPEHAARDLDVLLTKAPAAKTSIDTLATSVASKIDGAEVLEVPLKSRARALEKIMNDYGGEASRIKDLARNTLMVPEGKQEDAVKAILQSDPQIDPVSQVKRTDSEKDPLGYSMIAVTVPTPSGVRGEIQILSPEMIAAKSPRTDAVAMLGEPKLESLEKVYGKCCMGHSYYERWRSLSPDAPEAREVASRSKAYYASYRKRSVIMSTGSMKRGGINGSGSRSVPEGGRVHRLPVRTSIVPVGKSDQKRVSQILRRTGKENFIQV